jgi:hypothetical protein
MTNRVGRALFLQFSEGDQEDAMRFASMRWLSLLVLIAGLCGPVTTMAGPVEQQAPVLEDAAGTMKGDPCDPALPGDFGCDGSADVAPGAFVAVFKPGISDVPFSSESGPLYIVADARAVELLGELVGIGNVFVADFTPRSSFYEQNRRADMRGTSVTRGGQPASWVLILATVVTGIGVVVVAKSLFDARNSAFPRRAAA